MGVEDHVSDGTGNSSDHSKFRAAIAADYRVHGLPEHIERDAQRDIEEVFLCERMGFLVDGASEQGKDGFAENEVDCRQHKAAYYTEYNCIANGLVGVLSGVSPQRDADKRTATVTDKYSDAERHHCQREHHRIGGVAVRAEVAGIGDKDLVNDVVKRAHQQRDDAGDGVLAHEPSNTLRPQKLISGFQKNHLSFKKIRNA